jgi:hypothetical protein
MGGDSFGRCSGGGVVASLDPRSARRRSRSSLGSGSRSSLGSSSNFLRLGSGSVKGAGGFVGPVLWVRLPLPVARMYSVQGQREELTSSAVQVGAHTTEGGELAAGLSGRTGGVPSGLGGGQGGEHSCKPALLGGRGGVAGRMLLAMAGSRMVGSRT